MLLFPAVLLICAGCFFGGQRLAADAGETARVLILYEEPFRKDNPAFPIVEALREYLAHFDVRVAVLGAKDYQEGALNGYQAVVYVGNSRRELPHELLGEMAKAPALVWFEDNIDSLAKMKGWDDFAFYGRRNFFVRLSAHGAEAPVDPYTRIYAADPGKEAAVFADVTDFKTKMPFAWQRENVFYLGRLDFGFPYYVLLADLLHRALPCESPSGYGVLLRIEDVTPFTNPKSLSRLIGLCAEEGIPYAVAVTPFAKNKGQEARLSEAKELIRVLHKAQETGGSIIMHGCFHENEYSPETGEGFEFWNPRDEKPMDGEPGFTRVRLEQGLEEFARAGVYPVAFEAPHYAMSSESYRELSRHFSAYVGQIQLSDETYMASLELPWLTKSPRLSGMLVYPETLGYVEPGDVLSTDKIMEKARFLKILPHAESCFFYHGFLPPEGLEPLILSLKDEGYSFISLREENFWVKGQHLKVWGGQGKVSHATEIKPVDAQRNDPLYRGPAYIINSVLGLTALLFGLVLFFGLIVMRLRRRRNRLYENNRELGK